MSTAQSQPVLVVGGAGFLGIPLVRRLRQCGRPVVVVDDGSAGTLGRLAEFREDADVRCCVVDLRDGARLRGVITRAKPADVVHLAALHFIPRCARAPRRTIEVNVTGTRNLLACVPATARFLFASTAAVYAPSARPHLEGDSVAPVEVYGHSKLRAEELVRTRDGADSTVARLVNLYGNGDPHPHLIPEILDQAGRSDHLRLGALRESRDYLHVEDAADALTGLLLDAPAGIYNVGTGQATTGDGVLETLRTLTGRDLVAELDPARLRAARRPCSVVDPTLITRTLPGWVPRSVATGLAELHRLRPELAASVS